MRIAAIIKSGRVILFVTLTCFFAGCGLPSYPALYAPILVRGPDSVESGLEFVFGITSDDDPAIFEGLELYYKLYTSTQIEDGQIDSDALRIVDRATLENTGFRRFLNTTSTGDEELKPLIPLDDSEKLDSDLEILIDFSPLISAEPSDYPVLTHGETDVSLARNASAVTGTYIKKGFPSDAFSGTDGDVPVGYGGDDPENVPRLYIALYSLTYGNDYASLEFNILSQPTYAGYIAIPGQ